MGRYVSDFLGNFARWTKSHAVYTFREARKGPETPERFVWEKEDYSKAIANPDRLLKFPYQSDPLGQGFYQANLFQIRKCTKQAETASPH